MKHLLIKLEYCWADEHYVPSIWITTEREFNIWKEELSIRNINEDIEISFGTNQWINFNNYDEIIDSLVIKEISESTYNEIVNFINNYGLIDLPYLLEAYERHDNN